MVGGWVEEAIVLDLYAGSGSFGLEALSRGAAAATFVESGNRALEALVAEWLEVPKRGVAVTGGTKSRLKSVMVSGDAATLGNMLAAKVRAS